MATCSQSTFDKGCYFYQDILCSTCGDEKLDTTADFYCQSCVKYYCGQCIDKHNKCFTKHTPFIRGDMEKWPVTNKVEDFLLKCDVHTDENLEMYCDDHSDLCCRNCAFLNHKLCQKVTLISNKEKSQSEDLQKLLVYNQTVLEEMKKLQGNQEASFLYVQSSYNEQLHTIQETRRKINAALDTIEQRTLKEMKDALTELQAASKRDVETCVRLQDELKQLRDAIQDIVDKSKLELSFIATRKCVDKIEQSETFVKKSDFQVKVSIKFQPNSEIVQYLSNLPGLGRIEQSRQTLMVEEDPNRVFIVEGKSLQNVRISRKSSNCNIVAICVLLAGQVLIADGKIKKVKMLDQQYQMVSDWSANHYIYDMCQITPSEVAVTVNGKKTHEVQFITVNNRQLGTGRRLQLRHNCNGIACNLGDLYITTGTALFKYTLSGKQVCKIYEDTSERYTVSRCAVSPTGDKLYIPSSTKLITLARDGSVLATFTHPGREAPYNVHVTPAGQVLLCLWSSTLLQVDSEGRRKLATLATIEDGLLMPNSVCYNRHTASIIVPLYDKNSILVFKVQ